VGSGVVYTEAYKDMNKELIGQSIKFNSRGSLGTRHLPARNWLFNAELMSQHISSAGLEERNIGVNS
jgi:hypothetical protein